MGSWHVAIYGHAFVLKAITEVSDNINVSSLAPWLGGQYIVRISGELPIEKDTNGIFTDVFNTKEGLVGGIHYTWTWKGHFLQAIGLLQHIPSRILGVFKSYCTAGYSMLILGFVSVANRKLSSV